MDLNLLVALDALLTEVNVTRAGERVGLSQSGMSGALGKLRVVVGDELLARAGREYRLTAKAAELVEPVRRILAEIDSMLASRSAFDPATSAREFTIAMSDYFAVVMLNSIVRELSEAAPNLRLRIEPLKDPQEQLRAGAVDVMVEPRGVVTDHPAITIMRDEWVLVADRDNELVHDGLTRDEFRSLTFVGYARGGATGSLAERYLATVGLELNTEIVVENLVTGCLIVRGTERVAIVPRRLAVEFEDVAKVRTVRIPYDIPLLQESLVWNRVNQNEPGNVWIRSFIEAVTASASGR